MSNKKNIITRLLLLIAIVTFAVTANTQPYCRIKTYSLSQGLSTNNITHIDQDSYGMMWFTSINGLWSFDGYDFMPHRDRNDFQTITTQRYLSARPNYSGGVYLTDSKRQLYLYTVANNSFYSISKILRSKGIDMNVLDIMTLENGHTWLIGMRDTEPGLVRIDDKKILNGEGIEVISREALHAATYKALVCSNGSEIIYGKIGVYAPRRGRIYDKEVLTCANIGKQILWGGKGNAVTLFNPQTFRQQRIAMPEGVDEVNNMVAIGKGRIACGTNKGLAIIDCTSRHTSLVNLQNPGSPSNHVTNIFLDSFRRLWVFTESDGVTVIQPNLKDKKWLMANADAINMRTTCDHTVWLEDLSHTIWTIPRGGTFCYYDETEKKLVTQPIFEQENSQHVIPSMKRTFIDTQKNLWFVSPHSFNMLSFGKYATLKVNDELFGEVRSILVDHNGDIWTGSEKGCLTVHSSKNKLKGYIAPNGKLTTSQTEFCPNIYSLMEDRKGRKWIGTKQDGVFVIYTDGKVKQFLHKDGDRFSLSDNRVNSIVEDKRGHIWLGTYGGGLNLVDERGANIRFVNINSGLGRRPLDTKYGIRRITETADGVLMLATTQGLVALSEKFSRPGDVVFHYYASPGDASPNASYDVIQAIALKSGRIFAGTISGELFEVDAKSLLTEPKMKKIFDEDNIDGPINGMFEDERGNIWVVHENNIDCYNPNSGKHFTIWPGKMSNYCDFTEAEPSVNHANGYVVIGTQDGYMTFNPKDMKPSASNPKIIFRSVLLNGEKDAMPIMGQKEIELPSDKHSFTVSFAALDYAESQFIKYSYKLEGVDKNWNNIGYDHRVSFNDLPTGTYRMLVRSTNSDGIWADNIESITIRAIPAWYETWFAKLFYLILAAGIIYLIYIYYKTRHIAAVEKIVSERKTMLYREASHKLRTPLTLIGGPIVEVMKSKNLSEKDREYLETARNSSRNMLKLVDSMLSDNMAGSYFVDDENAPVFANDNMADDEDANSEKDTRILVVEDNDDLRKFLVSLLSPVYTVITARNGKEGLELATAQLPDFILSDVTMPVMDGLTMVNLIKRNPEICHIPIIILSARASADDKAQGIEQGIDDYITKPFSARYLKQRMAEVIAHHRVEQQTSAEEIQQSAKGEYHLSNVNIVDYDREMMSHLMDYLEEHIKETDLRVDDMAAAVNLGRTVFFTKLKSIVGMSPNDFLRSLRIKRASELLAKSQLSIAEISIAVGFNDQRYFSRVFKKETGCTPTEYRSREQNN